MQRTVTTGKEAPAAAQCPACGAATTTAFCGECGAEQGPPPDLSLRRFVAGAVRELTVLDSRLLGTLRALLLRPGLLTREYVRSRSRRVLGPLRTFFIANATFFVAQSVFLQSDTFTTTLRTQLQNIPAIRLKAALVARKLAAENTTLPQLAARWDAVAVEHGKTLVILLVPIYAAVLALVLAYRRRPLVQHLVFSAYFVAFVLLLLIIFPAAMAPVFFLGRATGVSLEFLTTDFGASLLLGLVLLVYLIPGLHRGYDIGRGEAALLAPLLVVGFLVALQFYRFALFLSVYVAT